MDGNRVLIGCADCYKIEDVDGGILTAAVMNEKDKPPAMLLESALIDLLRENYFIEKKPFYPAVGEHFCCANTSAFTKPNKQRLKIFHAV